MGVSGDAQTPLDGVGGQNLGWVVVKIFLAYAALNLIYNIFSKIRNRFVFVQATKHLYSPPEPNPFVGWFPSISKNKLRRLDWWLDMYKQSGVEGKPTNMIALPAPYLFPTASGLLHTMDPANVKHILKDNFNNYIKTEPMIKSSGVNIFREWMGEGIFTIDHGPHAEDGGAQWFHQRKLAAHMFTMSNFRTSMHDTFVANSDRMRARIEREVAAGNPELDIQDLFFRLTMDSFTTIGFGGTVKTLDGGEDHYATAFDGAHDCVISLFLGVKVMIPGTLNFVLPWPLNKLAVAAWRRTDKGFKEFAVYNRTLRQTTQKMIDQRRADGCKEATDILGIFMNAKDSASNPLSDELLQDIVMNFMIAGRDTTACTLSWTFYILATNPRIKARLEEELKAELTELPTYDEIRKLKYLKGVIYESLRLFPPVPHDPKTAVKADTLPDGTVVPANARVFFFPYGMGRNPEIWEDPLEVKPERWYEGEADPFKFPVFQAGPRICLGKDMAIMEAATVTALTLRCFDFDLVGKASDYTYSKKVTMSISPCLNLKMKPRKL